MRILGPGRSAMMARRCPVEREASLKFRIVFSWLLKSPWEKLSRAIFIPARIICSITFLDSDAGPSVQTIFVLCVGKTIFIPPALGSFCLKGHQLFFDTIYWRRSTTRFEYPHSLSYQETILKNRFSPLRLFCTVARES